MREAIIIIRTGGEPKVRLFPSATDAKEEFRALVTDSPANAIGLEMWTSDEGRIKRRKLNRPKGPEKKQDEQPVEKSQTKPSGKTSRK